MKIRKLFTIISVGACTALLSINVFAATSNANGATAPNTSVIEAEIDTQTETTPSAAPASTNSADQNATQQAAGAPDTTATNNTADANTGITQTPAAGGTSGVTAQSIVDEDGSDDTDVVFDAFDSDDDIVDGGVGGISDAEEKSVNIAAIGVYAAIAIAAIASGGVVIHIIKKRR